MKYWVYLNEKVEGPYDNDKLVTLNGFTPDTLICSEQSAASGSQEWVKASTVFEFEQEKPQTDNGVSAAVDAAATTALLAKLDNLTKEISNLHSKLDNMESHIDDEFAQSRAKQEAALAAAQEAARVAAQEVAARAAATQESVPSAPQAPVIPETVAPVQEEITPLPETQPENIPVDTLPKETQTPVTTTEEPIGEKTSAEEELVIRSALDSLYNAKLVAQEEDTNESTFQDLLTPQQAKDLASQSQITEPETQPASAPEVQEEQAQPEVLPVEPEVQEQPAPQQTQPAEEEQAQDQESLLDELTMAPADEKNDVLDQIIAEKQAEEKDSSLGLDTLGVAAAAGAAAWAASGDDKKEEEQPADFTAEREVKEIDFSQTQEPMTLATDKENPDQVEPVLPAEQMPADVPQADDGAAQAEQPADENLPSLDESDSVAAQLDAADEKEDTMQELVPGVTMEKPEGVLITEEDLKEAFNQKPAPSEDIFANPQELQPEEKPAHENPNDLTEVELKAGSTYLISDFVPPATTDAPAPEASELGVQDKTTEIQDILASEVQNEQAEVADDIAAALEQTTKRGASLDIKTVPMVQEPSNSERLKIDGLDDVNTQHDMKTADTKSSGLAKAVVGILILLVLLIVGYVVLAFMQLIPAQYNLFAKKQAQPAAVNNAAILEETTVEQSPVVVNEQDALPATEEGEEATAPQDEQAVLSAVLSEVQQYTLPNGYPLQAFIEAKHPAVAADLITWDISTAVEPDNYSVLVKVPPENPQSFKISYRFNYNAVTKTLDPTISDAKNLLDSASNSQLPAGL